VERPLRSQKSDPRNNTNEVHQKPNPFGAIPVKSVKDVVITIVRHFFDNKHTGGRFLQLTDSVFHFGFAEKVFAGVLLNKT